MASVYIVLGVCLLIAAVVPTALSRLPVTAPMVLTAVGFALGLTPIAGQLDLDPVTHRDAVQHVTEATVLVALMGVGLAIDRPLHLRQRLSWARWSPAFRLLALGLPLTIAGVAVVGWAALGIAPATALLLGAVLSPTDPVLASDVQVEGPTTEAGLPAASGDGPPAQALEELEHIDEDDEVRFALTSEAGLNDGLAFPFVRLAVLVAAATGVVLAGSGSEAPSVPTLLLDWAGEDLVLRLLIGLVVGWAMGRLLAAVAFRAPRRSLRLAEQGDPLLVVAALALSYGACELVHGYGFLAVFVCAMTIRAADPRHGYHEAMHGVIERLERLLTLVVLLILGFTASRGLLAALDWRGVVVATALILVIRPVFGYLSLRLGQPRRPEEAADDDGGAVPLTRPEAAVAAFFGVRGIGSIYYLAWACGEAAWPDERWLWATVAFTIIASVVIHGLTVKPALAWLDRHRERVASGGHQEAAAS